MDVSTLSERNVLRQYSGFDFVDHFGCVSGLGCRSVIVIAPPLVPVNGLDLIVATGVCESVILTNQNLNGEIVNRLRISSVESEVTCFGQVPDDPLIVIGYNCGSVYVCHLSCPEDDSPKFFCFEGHKRSIECLAFSSVQKCIIASGSRDCSVIVWDLVAEKGLFQLNGHLDAVECLQFSTFTSKQEYIVSGSKDRTLRIWDIEVGQCVRCIPNFPSTIWSLTMIDDRFLVCSDLTKMLYVYFFSLSEEDDQSSFLVRQLSPLVRSGRLKTKSLINFEHGFACLDSSGKCLQLFEYVGYEKAVNRSCKRQANDIDSQDVFIRSNIFEDKHSKMWNVCYCPNSGFVAATNDNAICVIRLKSNNLPMISKHFGGHRDFVQSLCISTDEKLIGASSFNCLKVWHTESRQAFRSFDDLENNLKCIMFTRNAVAIIAGDSAGYLMIFNLVERRIQLKEKIHGDSIVAVAFTAANQMQLVSASKDCSLSLWKLESESSLIPAHSCKFDDHVTAIALTPNEELIACALVDCTVKVVFSGTLKRFLNLYGHSGPVVSLDVSFDSELLVSGSTDRTIRIWGLRFGDCRRSLVYHEDEIVAVRFVPHTYHLFAASKDSKVSRWDVEHFQRIQILKKSHYRPISCMACGTQTIVTASMDRTIRLWRKTDRIVLPKVEIAEEQGSIFEKDETSIALPHKGRDDFVCPVVPKSENLIDSVDTLIEMLELCNGKKGNEISATMMNAFNVSVVEDLVKCQLEKIRPNILCSAIAMVPFSRIPHLCQLLHSWLERRESIELCAKCTLVILINHQSSLSTSEHVDLVHKLCIIAKIRIKELYDVVEYTTAALNVAQLNKADRSTLMNARNAKKRRIVTSWKNVFST
ncbi:hypothetical protein ACOME3_001377 [Neoechinorhynchus agilis]